MMVKPPKKYRLKIAQKCQVKPKKTIITKDHWLRYRRQIFLFCLKVSGKLIFKQNLIALCYYSFLLQYIIQKSHIGITLLLTELSSKNMFKYNLDSETHR